MIQNNWEVLPPYSNQLVYPIGQMRGDGNCDIVAEVNSCGGMEAEASRNARLVAAAPDLLAALKSVVAALTQPVQFTGSGGKVANILRRDATYAVRVARAAICGAAYD